MSIASFLNLWSLSEPPSLWLWITVITLSYMVVLMILGWISFDQRRIAELEFQAHRRRLEDLVSARTQELQDQNFKLEKTIEEINRLQQTMVAQEKLASLGRLSAGIAHEIKNPINMIVNSSKIISNFVRDDLNDYLQKILDHPSPMILELFNEDIMDIKIACDLIAQNGDRADSIIKSMLTQVRNGISVTEKVNLNQLIEESLDFVIHSAQFARFLDLKIVKNFTTLPTALMVRQDVFRVFVNIFENAFYAMAEKKKKELMTSYQPELIVLIEPTRTGSHILIRDNGTGISTENLAKVCEPFFTTKPAGEGTGLGLAMVHDLILAQKGEMKINSELGKFTEVMINLPLPLEIENVKYN